MKLKCPICGEITLAKDYDKHFEKCLEQYEVEIYEEQYRQEYEAELRNYNEMQALYTYDEGGFCDGFTNY